MGEQIIFWSLAFLITLCSTVVVTSKNPVSAAAFLIMNLFLLAGMYAFQGADFVAAIQIIVYSGAIVVLFLFVIMILNLEPEKLKPWNLDPLESITLLLVVAGFSFLSYKIFNLRVEGQESLYSQQDNTFEVASLLFSKFVWPFEIVSILILLAIVGSKLIAKKPKTQRL